jgi:hypothetical protein
LDLLGMLLLCGVAVLLCVACYRAGYANGFFHGVRSVDVVMMIRDIHEKPD